MARSRIVGIPRGRTGRDRQQWTFQRTSFWFLVPGSWFLVFGWEIDDTEFEGGAYTIFKVNGQLAAGGMDMSFLPSDVPPHWLVYFAVDDTAGTVAKARELGAQILQEPKDTPMGPIAVVQDPVGAVFAVIQLTGGGE
jgi:predicted enzyme related to lactoylglutathione lyase